MVDTFVVVLHQVVLGTAAESCAEEFLLTLKKLEFPVEGFWEREGDAHLKKGLIAELLKIPVHKIVFVPEMPVEGWAGHAGLFDDFAYGNVINAASPHQRLHRFGDSVFCFVVLAAHADLLTSNSMCSPVEYL